MSKQAVRGGVWFDGRANLRHNRESGPVAQLGARFHGMEEVIGSIPIRSTNYFNNLAEPPPRAWQQIGSKSQFAICRRSASFLPTPF